MSTKINTDRLVTLNDFLAAHPKITENQLRWALRHRDSNGLKPYVFRRVSYRSLTLLVDPAPVARWFGAVVKA